MPAFFSSIGEPLLNSVFLAAQVGQPRGNDHREQRQADRRRFHRLGGPKGVPNHSGLRFCTTASAAQLFRAQDFDDGGVMRRQALLAAQASTLKRLAENFNIPVLVSNQVTTTSQRPYYEFDRPHFGGGTSSYVGPPFSLRDS
jgi:hypothetical protein